MAKKRGQPAAPEPKPRVIDRQNRVALTNEAMAALGVKPGDYVALDVEGRSVRVHKVSWKVEKE